MIPLNVGQRVNRIRLWLHVVFTFCLVMLATGCAKQPSHMINGDEPGFLLGLLHGFLLLFSFVASLFSDYRIYAFPNSGVWYDFGFLLGLPFSVGWIAIVLSPGARAAILICLMFLIGIALNPFSIFIALCVWSFLRIRH
jgi:hypothetical protein